MLLKDELWLLWERLGEAWIPYLQLAGLDLAGANKYTLMGLLLQPIEIDFSLPGLEELRRDTRRGIEPGDPSRSLLYHAFASPHVIPEGMDTEQFPEMADLNLLENVIYSAALPSIADLRRRARGAPLAVAVFAYEYAVGRDTVHGHHADLCFSRTGVSRIGETEPHYVHRSRGFLPHAKESDQVHAIPARFGVFIAARRLGDRATFGPDEFQPGDEKREFWVPMHKLFNGGECVEGFYIQLEITTKHFNDKVRRVHLALQREGTNTGWSGEDFNREPFLISNGLTQWDQRQGLMVPEPHPLVEPAVTKDGRIVTFPTPPHHPRLPGTASLHFEPILGAHRSPEFVHAKHALANGQIVFLQNSQEKIDQIVDEGGYDAVNFIDHTGDGFLSARCAALAAEITIHLPAYSIIGQPDFFPLVKQRDLYDWWQTSAPSDIKNSIWPDTDVRPTPLSTSRLPVNITMEGTPFDSVDTTLTAVVGSDRAPGPAGHIVAKGPHRESWLSTRSTSFFDPGWDTTQDFNRDAASPNGVFHLAPYGLGSPYLEDTVLCAALGAYWPGAVPDATREFAPHNYPSVTPLFDEDLGFDGTLKPVISGDSIRYQIAEYFDYVEAVGRRQLNYERFAGTQLEEYIARTLAVARLYQSLGAASRQDRAKYLFPVFRRARRDEIDSVEFSSGVILNPSSCYYLQLAPFISQSDVPERPDLVNVTHGPAQIYLIDPATVALRRDDGSWQIQKF